MYLHFLLTAHELRTLILDEGVPPGEVVAIGPNHKNVIAFYEDGAIELLVTKYKTDQCYGPSKVTVPCESSMHYYLKLYVSKFRDKLLMGADPPFSLSMQEVKIVCVFVCVCVCVCVWGGGHIVTANILSKGMTVKIQLFVLRFWWPKVRNILVYVYPITRLSVT